MEDYDRTLLEQQFDANPRFRLLYEEHLLLEKELNNLNQKPYLTPVEEVEKKKVQKLKLAGKDEMDRILKNCRQ
jgi:uncharacterized protein YdcH (DUF465 family)